MRCGRVVSVLPHGPGLPAAPAGMSPAACSYTSLSSDCVGTVMVHGELPSTYLGTFPALLRRATTYKHQNKPQEAADDLRRVLQVEPDNDLAKVRIDNIF